LNQIVSLIDRAVVVWASHYQFPPGERLRFPAVHSRYMVWILRGTGQIIANGKRFDAAPGMFLILPWEHSISYRAADRDPFLVGGVHVVPVHDRRHPVVFHVAHGPDKDLWHATYRYDVPLEALSQVLVGELAKHPALGHLAEYVVSCFLRGEQEEAEMRELGRLILLEFDRSAREAETQREFPPVLQHLTGWVEQNLDQPIGLGQLAQRACCSRSTVQRLTRKYLKQSALEWIIQLKVSRATRLLMSTHLPVSEVARQVGFSDPYYFSRLFSSKTGESPRQCRSRGRFL
jgi:AraC-like DNA-binding protein